MAIRNTVTKGRLRSVVLSPATISIIRWMFWRPVKSHAVTTSGLRVLRTMAAKWCRSDTCSGTSLAKAKHILKSSSGRASTTRAARATSFSTAWRRMPLTGSRCKAYRNRDQIVLRPSSSDLRPPSRSLTTIRRGARCRASVTRVSGIRTRLSFSTWAPASDKGPPPPDHGIHRPPAPTPPTPPHKCDPIVLGKAD